MFDDICTRILSPPKFKYSMYDLGSTMSKHGKRTDFIVENNKEYKMNCSFYEPHVIKYDRACVIYLHSMNGSRLEGNAFVYYSLGLVYSEFLLQEGISYCTFDFSACGNSQGDKISFGASEKYDVELVIKKLKETFYLNKFILWGRSMGAVAAVKYAELCYDKSKTLLSFQKGEILGLVLDSAFKSLSQLLIEIGHTQTDIPKFLIQAGYFLIKNSLEENGEFKIEELDLISQEGKEKDTHHLYPLMKIKSLDLPILFLASKEDKTVPCQHSIDMFNAYESKMKEMEYFRGLHNESRAEDYLEKVIRFVRNLLNESSNRQTINNLNSDKEQKSVMIEHTNQDRRRSLALFSDEIDVNKREALLLPQHRSKTATSRKMFTHSHINHNSITVSPTPTIPDPVSLPQTPHKPTLIELIESSIFKSSNTDNGQETVIETESIQETCLCAMIFDNNLEHQSMTINNKINTTKDHQEEEQENSQQHKKLEYYMEKDVLVKNYNWVKYSEAKANFNCDRISLKDSLKISQNNKIKFNQQIEENYDQPLSVASEKNLRRICY